MRWCAIDIKENQIYGIGRTADGAYADARDSTVKQDKLEFMVVPCSEDLYHDFYNFGRRARFSLVQKLGSIYAVSPLEL